ncbi:MAG: rhodanese-like domain-containing protein [FCB group bacterium]|nr:rhodanese-like domain-containing protein [FCB group bacterium]
MKLNQRILTSAILILLGLVIAMVPENTTRPYKLTPQQMVEEISIGTEMIQPDELADWLINNDPTLQLIDVRDPDAFDQFHLPGAVNIPLKDLLSDEWVDYLDQDVKMNVLYSNGTTKAHNCWMILDQLGYENNYVLQGGLNYWVETILNPQKPGAAVSDDELARYDFRKGASQALGGGIQTASPAVDKPKKAKPPVKRRKKKKAPEGGC